MFYKEYSFLCLNYNTFHSKSANLFCNFPIEPGYYFTRTGRKHSIASRLFTPEYVDDVQQHLFVLLFSQQRWWAAHIMVENYSNASGEGAKATSHSINNSGSSSAHVMQNKAANIQRNECYFFVQLIFPPKPKAKSVQH
uniref:Uncharacterized protein n=1 Tax=Anopheles gambiae TaxID=7165 RepID=A0A903XXK2_ANOGA